MDPTLSLYARIRTPFLLFSYKIGRKEKLFEGWGHNDVYMYAVSPEENKTNEAIDALQALSDTTEEREYDTFWLDIGQIIVPVLFLVCCLAVMYIRGMFNEEQEVPTKTPTPTAEAVSAPATKKPSILGGSNSGKFITAQTLYDMRQQHVGFQVTVKKPGGEQITVKRQFKDGKLNRVKVLRGVPDSMWFIIDTKDGNVAHKVRGDVEHNEKDFATLVKELEIEPNTAKRIWYGLWQCGNILPVSSMRFIKELEEKGRKYYVLRAGDMEIWLDYETKLPLQETIGTNIWSYDYSKAQFSDDDFSLEDGV